MIEIITAKEENNGASSYIRRSMFYTREFYKGVFYRKLN